MTEIHRPKALGKHGRMSILALVLTLLSGCLSKPDTSHFKTLSIQGTPPFRERVEKALALLEARSPQGFNLATNYIGVIRQAEHSGMRANENPPVFDLNDRSAFYSLTWCAGVIAHDSFHSKLYHDYKLAHHTAVPASAWGGDATERQCLVHQLRVLGEVGAPTNELAHCQLTGVDYAKVPYEKRNW